ncbi:MAG: hypothetical protein QM731_04355 [Chitinophagaceae bacterium]
MQPLLAVVIGTVLLLCAKQPNSKQQSPSSATTKQRPLWPARSKHKLMPGTLTKVFGGGEWFPMP